MGMFSNYALQAGAEGQDIATAMRRRALLAQQEEGALKDQQTQRAGRELLGRVLQGFGGVQPQGMSPLGIPQSPAPGQPSVPRATMSGPPSVAGTPMGAPPAQSGPGAAPNVGGPPAQQATGAPAGAGAMPFSWRAVAEEVRKQSGADPGAILAAMQGVMPQIEKEADRESKAATVEAQIQQKREALMANLQWRYYNSNSQTERTQILADVRKLTTQMQTNAQRDVAGINAQGGRDRANIAADSAANVARIGAESRFNVAQLNGLNRQTIAEINNKSREQIAADALALKKELGVASLDLKADEIAKTFLYKERMAKLKERGMNDQQAQFWAKLDLQRSIAADRDETTRRGQDLLLQGRQVAADAKREADQSKVEAALPMVLDQFDDVYKTAEALLMHPGLDNATGPVEQYLLTVQGDTANFESKLNLLKSKIGFKALADMRAASPTGGALGNVSNREVEFLQNSVESLALAQTADAMQEALRGIMDNASRGKARTLQAYETRYRAKPGGGSVPVANPNGQGKPIPTPKEVLGKRDGTRFEMDGTQYEKRGAQSVPVQ